MWLLPAVRAFGPPFSAKRPKRGGLDATSDNATIYYRKEIHYQFKKGIVLGVANKRSIAWGIAQKLNDEGARIGLNYLNEKLGDKVKALAKDLNNPVLAPCDLTKDAEVNS